jgi:hypothetical protein
VARSELALYYSYFAVIFMFSLIGLGYEADPMARGSWAHSGPRDRRLWIAALCIQLMFSLGYQIVPATRPSPRAVLAVRRSERDGILDRAIRSDISGGDSVLTQASLGCYVSGRRNLHLFYDYHTDAALDELLHTKKPDVILIDLHPHEVWYPEEMQLIERFAQRASHDAAYAVAVDQQGILLLKKRS